MTNSVVEHESIFLETLDSIERNIQNAREFYSFNKFVTVKDDSLDDLRGLYREYILSITQQMHALVNYYDSLIRYYSI
jgi:hypothetical protein